MVSRIDGRSTQSWNSTQVLQGHVWGWGCARDFLDCRNAGAHLAADPQFNSTQGTSSGHIHISRTPSICVGTGDRTFPTHSEKHNVGALESGGVGGAKGLAQVVDRTKGCQK
ncbi:unnamed protein product [Effrenium voratum]|nr:unnamed protein product [Effrenium voratum]